MPAEPAVTKKPGTGKIIYHLTGRYRPDHHSATDKQTYKLIYGRGILTKAKSPCRIIDMFGRCKRKERRII